MIMTYNLSHFTEKENGYTPSSFALARTIEAVADLIDEYKDHNELDELGESEKLYLNALIKHNNKLVQDWSKYGDASASWREEIK
jgi:hypothetical protein